MREAENVETVGDKPKVEVLIADCGQLDGDNAELVGSAYPEFPDDATVPEGMPELDFRLQASEAIRTDGNTIFKQVHPVWQECLLVAESGTSLFNRL